MAGIGLAVTDFGGRVVLEHFNHTVAEHQCPEGEVAVRNRFGRAHHFGLNAPKTCTGPPVGRDDFVGNQQDAISVTDALHHRREGMGRDHLARARDRFHNHGCDCASTLKRDFVFKGLHAQMGQFLRIGFFERVAVGVGRRDVETPRRKGFIGPLGVVLGGIMEWR